MIKEITEADKIIDDLNNVNYEKIEILKTKLEKTTSSFSDNRVDGGQRLHSREDALLLYAEMTKQIDNAEYKLKDIYNKIPKENRNLRIYFDKVYFKLSNAKLQLKYGLTKQQINRIIKKIKREHQCSPDVPVKR